jgi:hypothetical protein
MQPNARGAGDSVGALLNRHMATFFCDHCREEVQFIPITRAATLAKVCRSTLYYWLERNWIHWIQRPSGRRLICKQSLMVPTCRKRLQEMGESDKVGNPLEERPDTKLAI